ncbi:hypothetical protein D3C76_1667960 [compost metagenome]
MRKRHASNISASHNQADGSNRKARRNQKLRVCCQYSWRVVQRRMAGIRLRAMTKPEIAKNRSTPHHGWPYRVMVCSKGTAAANRLSCRW